MAAGLHAGQDGPGRNLGQRGSVPASGRISGMHIFAAGIGPLPAQGTPQPGVSS